MSAPDTLELLNLARLPFSIASKSRAWARSSSSSSRASAAAAPRRPGARGLAFSCLTEAITRFLISYVQAIRTRSKRMILVEDKNLEQYRANDQLRTELPAELKSKIRNIQTRFNQDPDRAALKLLIKHFLLERLPQPQPRP